MPPATEAAAPELPRVASSKPSRGGLSTVELFAAGAGAGVISKTITAPIDRIRILFQVSSKRPFSAVQFVHAGFRIVRADGVLGLWRGNLAVVMRVMPYAGLQFGAFARYRSLLESFTEPGRHDVLIRFCAGALAGATATTFTYPLDLLRTQMAVSASSISLRQPQTSYLAAAEETIRNEGYIGLFYGIRPTLLGIVPHAGVSFMLFETLKPYIQKEVLHLQNERDLPMHWRLAAGGVAGFISQGASYPLHVVRRRMQAHLLVDELQHGSVVRAMLHIWRTEGFAKGLYKGASLTLVKGPLSAAFGFAANDHLKVLVVRANGDPDRCPPNTDPNTDQVEGLRVGSSKNTPLEQLISGAVAGSCAKTVIAPGDRVKILYQTNSSRRFSWRGVYRTFSKIITHTGPRGLWRGHTATLMRVVPYSATSYTTFDYYRRLINSWNRFDRVTTRFVAGACAGATATAVTYPLDMMRARMAAHWEMSPKYANYMLGFKEIVREEGWSNLFRGMRPTLLGIMPYAGLSFMAFETLKVNLVHRLKLQGGEAEISTPARLSCGALAGVFAQSTTYPLDIVRRRMQVHPDMYRNEWHAMRDIVKTEGVRGGLFKGVTMNWIKGPIAVAVSFTVNDKLKSLLSGS